MGGLLRDEADVLIQAQTGSGKTLAFVLPCLAKLSVPMFQVGPIRSQVGPQMLQVRCSETLPSLPAAPPSPPPSCAASAARCAAAPSPFFVLPPPAGCGSGSVCYAASATPLLLAVTQRAGC